jgi:hypothetical protein
MNATSKSTSRSTASTTFRGQTMSNLGHRQFLTASTCLIMAISLNPCLSAFATLEDNTIAQALPTPLPPLPGTTPTGEQYLVLVGGTSDLLLNQVRQIEPGAFINYVNGESVIQAGRFSDYSNAQVRAEELSLLGVEAQIQAANAVGAPIEVSPALAYDIPYNPPLPTSSSSMEAIPPLPSSTVAATPSSIEFGETPPYATISPPTAAVTTTPTVISTPPPSVGVAPVFTEADLSGYLVVIPGSPDRLPEIVSQVISLGVPSSLVRTRTSPRGPHVAIGPYSDRSLAQDWTNFLNNSGVSGARVFFE